ncbi:MAG TPA: YdcF family protein [Beutenbergiaceae bacterium]|nr:YdcF family protein [Beutenbergiaceae bacterium]
MLALYLAAVILGLVVWGEISHFRSSRRFIGSATGPTEAVVVLGYRNEDADRLNLTNRWRVRAAVRSIDPEAKQTRLVCCGGAVVGATSEATLLARYARELGFTGQIVLEEQSRNTWENIVYAAPLIEGADRIKIVSNPWHAQEARMYLHRQRPDLARRLVAGAEYRMGEQAWLKPFATAYAYGRARRARKENWLGRYLADYERTTRHPGGLLAPTAANNNYAIGSDPSAPARADGAPARMSGGGAPARVGTACASDRSAPADRKDDRSALADRKVKRVV